MPTVCSMYHIELFLKTRKWELLRQDYCEGAFAIQRSGQTHHIVHSS